MKQTTPLVKLLMMFVWTVLGLRGLAQSPTFEMYVTNQSQLDSKTYQFDVYLLRTGSTALELASMQFGLGIDTSIANGGTLSFSYVSGSSQLSSGQAPTSFQVGGTFQTVNGIVYRYLNQAAKTPPGSGNGTIISSSKTSCASPGTRIGTYRLTNTVDFRQSSSCKHVFSTSAASQRTNTLVTGYVGGINTTLSGTNYSYNAIGTCDQNISLNGCAVVASITDNSGVSCFGGSNGSVSISLSGAGSASSGSYSVDGGTAVSYSSNPFTVSGLSAGSHSISITSGSCSASTGSFTISGPSSALSSSFSASGCDSYTLPWGTTVTASGAYTHIYASAAGCDSTVTANITITASTSNTTSASACDSYTWSVNGQTYTTSGSYSSVSGCHTEILNLTVTASTSNASSASACDSYTWSVNGQTYTTSGSYTSVSGCATSILNLTITASTSNATSASACDSYTWSVNGQTYTTSGSYTSVSGCATSILNLTITASTSNTTSASACDSYTWSVNGQTYTTSGSYTSVSGCATSILNLTVNASTSSSSDVTACNSYTLPWGNVVTTSGSYSNIYTSAGGCDSTVTVNVTINSSTNSTENVSICSSAAPYVWLSGNGLSYSTSGTYSFTYTNEAGCSSVATLVLTVNSASSSSVSRAICSNQLPYTWNGVIFTAAGTQSVTLVNAAGCDSVVTMTLSVSGGTPTAVTAVTQTLVANNCGARVYRYSAGSVANASGYDWTLPTSVGGVSGVTVDSGDITSSRVIRLVYASNLAALSTDSIKVRAYSGCGSASRKGFKLSNLAWAPLAAPTITATTLVNNVCGARKVRYTTPVPATTAGAVGFEWSFVGLGLGANASIDSGTTESRVIVVLYTSNAAAGANDSVRVRYNYNNGCSYGAYGRSKITLGALNVPGSPTITATTVVNNICGGRKVRYSVPVTPAATALAGAATGYEWSFVGSGLGANASIDSGTVNSRVIVVLYTSNAAAGANDSVRCRYSSDCGYGANGKLKIGLGLLNTPAAPTAITITAIAPSVCGAKLYRYAAPALPVATTTAGAATGYEWSFTGTLGSDATIDSGDVTSRVIVVRYTSNAAAGAGDSVRVRYNSGCGYGPNKASKLTNVVTAVPLAPTAITVTAVSASTCGARVYRYAAPALPAASATAAAATGYEWSFTGVLGSNATIDSGDVSSRIILVRYTLNSAALAGDSVRVRYTSSCGYSARKASKLTNTALTGCPPPVAKVSTPAVFGVNVYPNPSNGLFNVQLSGATSEVVNVRILDAQGRYIKAVRAAGNGVITLGSDLKAGAYLLEVRQGNNVKTTRVLKF